MAERQAVLQRLQQVSLLCEFGVRTKQRGEGVPLHKGLSKEGFDVAAHGVGNSVQL